MNLHPYVAGQLADYRMSELRHEAERHRRWTFARDRRPARRPRGRLALSARLGEE